MHTLALRHWNRKFQVHYILNTSERTAEKDRMNLLYFLASAHFPFSPIYPNLNKVSPSQAQY